MRLETTKPLIKIFGELTKVEASSYLINSKNEEVLRFTNTNFTRSINSDEYELIATSKNNNKIIPDVQGVKIVTSDAIVYIYYDQKDEVFKFGSYTLKVTIIQSILNKEFLLSNSAEITVTKEYADPYLSSNAGPLTDYLRKTYAKLGASYSVPIFFLKTPTHLGFVDYCDGEFPLLIYSTEPENNHVPEFTIRDLVSGLEFPNIIQVLGNHYVNYNNELVQLRNLNIIDSNTLGHLSEDSGYLDIQNFVVEKRRGSSKIKYIKDYLYSLKYGSQSLKQSIDIDFNNYVTRSSIENPSKYQPLPNYEVGNLIISIWVFQGIIRRGVTRRKVSVTKYYVYDKSSLRLKTFSSDDLGSDISFEFFISFDGKEIDINGNIYNLSLESITRADWFVDILGSKYKYIRSSNIIIHDSLL